MEWVRVEGLCRDYGEGASRVRALDHVSFTVEKGEMVAVIGKSGSGKSTLMHLLGGVDRPDGGKIWVEGLWKNAGGDGDFPSKKSWVNLSVL